MQKYSIWLVIKFKDLSTAGCPPDKRAHDEKRQLDDWLPDPLGQSQLFQDGGHKPSGQQDGSGLCAGWDP